MTEFTKQQLALISIRRAQGKSARAIADELGVSEYRVEHVLGMRNFTKKPRQESEEVDRVCSKCGAPFKAETRFIRLCTTCKSTRAWRDGADDAYAIGRR